METVMMEEVIFADDGPTFHSVMDAGLKNYENEFKLIHAENGKKAIDILGRQPISAVITDMIMPGINGVTLLKYLEHNFPELPCIVLSAYNTPKIKDQVSAKGYSFIEKPVQPQLLANTIKNTLAHSRKMFGLGKLSLSGIVQLIEYEKESCIVGVVLSNEEKGTLLFYQGELYDAYYGEIQGEEAAIQLVAFENKQITYRSLPLNKKLDRKIHLGVQSILLQGVQKRDEEGFEEADQKFDRANRLLDEGISLCKRFEIKKSRKKIEESIKLRPENPIAWLWLSRTLFSPKQIKYSLEKAYQYAPTNNVIIREIKKVRLTLNGEIEDIIHCPFCYAPGDSKMKRCSFCKGYIVVDSETLPDFGNSINRDVLTTTLWRFEELLASDMNNGRLLYYTVLCCLNLGEDKKAMRYVQSLKSISKNGDVYYRVADLLSALLLR